MKFLFLSGMELGQLQAQDQSHWPHWLLEHCNHVSRWFSMCLRWQGCQSHVVGERVFSERHCAYFLAEWHILGITLHLLAWSHCLHCGHCFELLLLLLSRAVFCLHQKALRWPLGHHQKVCWCKRHEDISRTTPVYDGWWRKEENREERSWKRWPKIQGKNYYSVIKYSFFHFFYFPFFYFPTFQRFVRNNYLKEIEKARDYMEMEDGRGTVETEVWFFSF